MTEGQIRAKVLEGICPFCGAGPFHVVAGHTVRVHDVGRRELRDLAGLYYSAQLTSPEYHDKRADLSRRLYREGNRGAYLVSRPGVKHDLSRAAVKLQKVKAAKVTDKQRREVGRQAGRDRLAASAGRDAEVLRLLDAGMTNVAIAAQVSINPVTVRAIAKRDGRMLDGRARYGASRRGVTDPHLEKGRATMRANNAADGAALVAAYEDGSTVYELADRRGIQVGTIRERLRRLGVDLPDGRADPDRPKRVYMQQPPWYCKLDGCDGVGRARGLCGKHYQRVMITEDT